MRRAANGTMGSVLSMTLPPSMVADIDRIARLCGVNRSEFIRTAVAEKAASMGFGHTIYRVIFRHEPGLAKLLYAFSRYFANPVQSDGFFGFRMGDKVFLPCLARFIGQG